MARTAGLSGFPEWLPRDRFVEQHVIDTARRTFELHGFAPVETRAVEPLDTLRGEGDASKEVYALRRLHAADGDEDSALGLHFDLTVPLARYVVENAGSLAFPFRRYQIQKAWRGERPQEGRFREFLQADIDVIGRDTLSFAHEAELPLVVAEALGSLGLPPIRIQTSNRKLAEGFYVGLGVDRSAVPRVLRIVDKVSKIGPGKVADALVGEGLTPAQAEACLGLAAIRSEDASFADRVRALGAKDDLLDVGLDELTRVLDAAAEHASGLVVADLSIARGLDYYTGTVYETQLVGHESIGSIASGGRYDALATDGATTYPGVGISIGVSRLVSRVISRGLLVASRDVPTCVLVALPDEQSRAACARTAAMLRRRGISTEVAPEPQKYGKQIRFADRRRIPYVWFPAGDSGGPEVRDIRTGQQVPADPETWAPPPEDLQPQVSAPQPEEST